MNDDPVMLEDFAPELAERTLPESDPDLEKHLPSRRDLFHGAALRLGAIASAPMLLAAASTEAFGRGGALPQRVVDTLNFALTLEYLEDTFYRAALASPGTIPPYARRVFHQISKHERAHVALLQGALGGLAVPKPSIDLTGKGQYGKVFHDFPALLALAQTFEDLGVRAYKGQAPNLMGTPVLETALRIHSVEARHAAEIRLLRGAPIGEGAFDKPESKALVLLVAGSFLNGSPQAPRSTF